LPLPPADLYRVGIADLNAWCFKTHRSLRPGRHCARHAVAGLGRLLRRTGALLR
jgi:hypothetical protein